MENPYYIMEGEGLNDIVMMRGKKTSQILHSYFKFFEQNNDEESQKKAIIKTAARLIKSDIKLHIPLNANEYLSSNPLWLDSALHYIPSTLGLFLNSMLMGKDNQR